MRLPSAPPRYEPHEQAEMRRSIELEVAKMRGDMASPNVDVGYRVKGVQVVGEQQAAVVDTAGATLVQLEAEVNALKALLRTHGLMAS